MSRREWLTLPEVASMLGVHRTTIRRYIMIGAFPPEAVVELSPAGKRVHKRRRVRRSFINRILHLD